MKIIEIKLKDFKKHHELEIRRPSGDNIFLVGDNDAGKTSVIQAVFGCLKAISLPKSVIKDGATESKVVVVIGDEEQEYTVTTKINADGDSMTLKSKEGATYSKPVTKLQELVGGLIYNIFELAQKKPTDQLAWVKQYFKINVDDLQAHYKQIYDERRDTNREAKRVRAEIANSGFTTMQIAESKEVDINELNAKIQDANNVNNAINLLTNGIESKKKLIANYKQQHLDIREQIRILQNQLVHLETQGNTLDLQIKEDQVLLDQQTFVNITELQEQFKTATEHNRKHSRMMEMKKLETKDTDLTNRSGKMTKQLDEIKEQIRQVIASSKLPTGFELMLPDGEDEREGLYLNGKPFSELNQSTSDIMKSTIALQEAINPNGLKVACIHRFESLGTKKRAEIGKFIAEHDIQAIIEVMQPGGQELTIKESL